MQQETNRKPRYRTYLIMLLLGLAVGLALTFSYMNAQLNQTQAELAAVYSRPIKTDTVVVNRVFRDTVRIVVRSKPKTVYVYTQPDTVRRKRLERDTLIAGLRLDSKRLEVEFLTPRGISIIENYPINLDLDHNIQVSNHGNVLIQSDPQQERKIRRQRCIRRLLITGAFFGGFVIGNTVAK